MLKKTLLFSFVSIFLSALMWSSSPAQEKAPPVIQALEGQVPSDAIVLFNGKDLSEWTYADGKPAGWVVADGAMTVKGGSIVTKKQFGDIQLHLEFQTPSPATGKGQDRGNSGVYIQGNYEVQVLDSYENETYIDGMLGAVYKLYPPLVNACRPPGVWQVYDIVFRAPKFGGSGMTVVTRANVTVFLNGVLVQDHVEVTPTGGSMGSAEIPRGSILLQDHNHPVKYRNIWVREL